MMLRRGTGKSRPSPEQADAPKRQRPAGSLTSPFASLLRNEKLFTILVMTWLSVVLYGDIIAFSSAVVSCGQRLNLNSAQLAHTSPSTQLPDVTRVLFVSDPQLTSPYSYPFMSNPVLNWAVSLYSDLYMRRAYVTIQSFLRPEVVFFNGDLFDGVTSTLHTHQRAQFSEREYQTLKRRWSWVFGGLSSAVAPRWLFNVSGNHDIGWRIDEKDQRQLIQTYSSHFGALNYQRRVGNFSFVVLGSGIFIPPVAPELSEAAESFLQSLVSDQDAALDRVLMFHVPLWRPPGEDCGPMNRRGPFYEDRGYSYTNLAPKSVSERLLRLVKPKYVFSGDAHDHCQITHRVSDAPNAIERTLNTFSWLQGNRVPSFGFAVLDNANNKFNFEFCELPDQLAIYIVYAVLAALTVFCAALFAQPSPDAPLDGSASTDEEAGLADQQQRSQTAETSVIGAVVARAEPAFVVTLTVFVSAVGWHFLLIWIYF